MDAEGGFEMAEFQEGTLDTMMERLCSSISGFDPEWVTCCVPATEEQIRQLQDIFAECHYTVPTAYLYYLYCITISLAVKPDCITLTGSIA